MNDDTYEVRVTRENGLWLGEVTNRDGIQTFARTYSGLREEMNDAIHLMDDLDDSVVVHTHWTFDLVEDAFVSANEIGERRKDLDEQAALLAVEAERVARELQKDGYSLRDISGALSMSPGRVSQIINGSRGRVGEIKMSRKTGAGARRAK